MSPLALYGVALALGLGVAFAAWFWHLGLKNAGVIDIAWGLNLALMAWVYALGGGGLPLRKWLIAGMVSFTGLRLSWHIARRTLGHAEEGRYMALRQEWGPNIGLKFLAFFVLQALLASLLSLPYLAACLNAAPELGTLEIVATAVFVVGFACESLADAQLATFKADPSNKGKTCRKGLWNFSRHPNYFFEWLMWLSYWLYACASPWGWATLFAPALMLHFLLNVTGVKITEEQCLRSRGEDYRRYQQETSAFVPWFKKA
jgi:steroid 5-alpha reductase family enzyme